MTMTSVSHPKLPPGTGRIVVSRSSHRASFSTLAFCYPLKLIVPSRHFVDGLRCVYLISYGGGMVAGDRVSLDIDVEDKSTLVILTQGSTKIFRLRPGHYPTSLPSTSSTAPTYQSLDCRISPSSTLILLPSPVTCFARSSYVQQQSFRLGGDGSSSLILLDWYTSGRSAMDSSSVDADRVQAEQGEEWMFDRYSSSNVVYLGDKVVVKDVLLLEDEKEPDPTSTTTTTTHDAVLPTKAAAPSRTTTYRPRVAPYSVYAALILFGPSTLSLRTHLSSLFSNLTQYNQPHPYSLIWSYSSLEKGQGGIVRVAGAATEEVKDWIREILQGGGILDLVGNDLWGNVFS